MREKSKQQRPEHYGLGVAEKEKARRTELELGGCCGGPRITWDPSRAGGPRRANGGVA